MSDPMRQVLDWSGQAAPFADGRCLHELFEQQAAQRPDAPAVVGAGLVLSYAELNRRANRLAHYLSARGLAGPDRLVGLCMERKPDMVVAVLAILKAGGAYLGLDPDYPASRLAHMQQDAGLQTVLTDTAACGLLPPGHAQALCLDDPELALALAACPEGNLACAARGLRGEHLAYAIYTSGSTGTPKGVLLEHRGAVNLMAVLQRSYGLRPDDTLLQFAPLGFDVAVGELFGALCNGARLVLRDAAWTESAQAFWRHCAQAGITVLDLPTAYWQELVRDPALVLPPALRHITVGGEKISDAALVRWFARGAGLPRLFNAYGPTETTVNASFMELRADSGAAIGRPIDNYRLYVLDADGALVAPGVPGELYVGGVGLARGYLNRPDLTAQRFVPNPFAAAVDASHSTRLYRTGDLVRWRADGQLEFLGRVDRQIKLRGYRIEPGEVEARLRALPGVEAAVVVLREDEPERPRLVAYVTASALAPAPHAARSLAWRESLQAELPPYMVPSAVQVLAALPLTLHGKVDHAALPAPDDEPADEELCGATETRLAALWREVLGTRGPLGAGANFLASGGDSLSATTLLGRLSQAFGVALPLSEFLGLDSLRAVAAAIDARLARHQYTDAPSIGRVGGDSDSSDNSSNGEMEDEGFEL